MVILRGWAEAPLSPKLQEQRRGARGRPIGRGITLKVRRPRTLLWRAVSISLARTRTVYRPPNNSNTPLCSGQGPQQAAHPTPAGTPHSQCSPAVRSLSLALSQEK